MPDNKPSVQAYKDAVDRDIKKIISFVTFGNLENKHVKITGLQMQYLDHTGTTKKVPLVVCDELFEEHITEGFKAEIDAFMDTPPLPPKTFIVEGEDKIEIPVAIDTTPKTEEPIVNGLRGPDHPDNKNGSFLNRLIKLKERMKG